jgi:hypothetical protein
MKCPARVARPNSPAPGREGLTFRHALCDVKLIQREVHFRIVFCFEVPAKSPGASRALRTRAGLHWKEPHCPAGRRCGQVNFA